MPIGTLTKKIHSQERNSVSTPPSSRPTAAPPAAIAPQTASALVRSSPSEKVVVMIESAAGETSAPPKPWSARAPISIVSEVASPLSSEATGEDRHPGDEQAPPADQVGHAPAEQQEAAEHQRVAVDDPLQRGVGDVEVGLDRRQRDVHDGRVEDDHELREADDDEG